MSRQSNAVLQELSRYTQGGLTESYNNRLGWWERTVYENRSDDIITLVRPSEAAKPMLISARIYNRDSLGWLVLQYNNIVDINEELVAGLRIALPHPSRVSLSILVNPLGGTPAVVS